MFEKQSKYSIRKLSVGTVSALIAAFMSLSTEAAAQEVKVDYKYVTTDELTNQERQLIKTNHEELLASKDEVYYLVYRPLNNAKLPHTSSKDAESNLPVALLAGSALLLMGIAVGKNRKKKVASLLILTTVGGSLVSPATLAIQNKKLAEYNQQINLSVGSDLPDPLKIDGYEFVGYITLENDVLKDFVVENKVPSMTLKLEEKPRAEIGISNLPGQETPKLEEKPELNAVQGIEEKLVSREVINFETSYVDDATMWEGETQVVTPGVVGEKQTVEIYPTVNGVIVGTPKVEERITPPTNQVEKRGIKPVKGEVTEVTKEVITKGTEYVEDNNGVVNTQVVSNEGKDGLKKITNVYETNKDQKTNLLSTKEEVITPAENKVIKVGTKETTRTENIAYETEYKKSDALDYGKEEKEKTGVVGEKTYTTTYKLENTSTPNLVATEDSGKITKEAQNEVVVKGTKPTETVTEIEIPTKYVADENLAYGTEKETQAGQKGSIRKTTTYDLNTQTGEITSTEETPVRVEAKEKIIAKGIKSETRTEVTKTFETKYELDTNSLKSEEVEKQAGVNEETKFTQTYSLNEKTGEVTLNPVEKEIITNKQDKIVKIGAKPTTRTEDIDFTIHYEEDATLEVGTENVKVEGSKGEKTYTTTFALANVNSNVLILTEDSGVETKAPVARVIVKGTRPRTVTRKIRYEMADSTQAPDSVTQTAQFTKTIVSTDPKTGLSIYSDWQSTNNQFVAVTTPKRENYVTDKETVEAKAVTAADTSEEVVVRYSEAIIDVPETRTITRTIKYVYEDDKEARPQKVQTLTYTRTNKVGAISKNIVTEGVWNNATQNFEEVVSPEIDGFTADKEKVEEEITNPDTQSKEVKVIYADKFLEVKDVDTASLYLSLGADGYTRIMALDKLPTDYSNYYVKVKSDQFKDLQLTVKSITEETVNGKQVYKVVTTHPKLKQDENYDGYEEDYTIYVAKRDTNLQGITSFRQLLDEIKKDAAGTYTLANDISAEGYDLNINDVSYIKDTFTGTLSGKNGENTFAIYDLKAPLFAKIGRATISDIALKNVDIDANHYDKVGALAGRSEGATIKNVVVQGELAISNNYGQLDGGLNGPGKVTLGGIVAEAAGGTTLDGNTFVGKLNGDSTGVRYFANNNFHSTELLLGGLAGSVVENSKLINNKLSVDIHVNAVDGVAVNWNKTVLGSPLYVGTLVGASNGGTYTNNYIEGTLVNQVENKNTYYGDGVDRSSSIGNVGELLGSQNRPSIKDNVVAVNVTNGDIVTPARSAEDVAKQEEIKKALELSNQYITNRFDVDYTRINGYQESHEKAYANMEKLLPFYNRAFIVKEANKLDAGDKLVTHKLLSVTPMKDAVVVSDVSGDKQAINKLLLHYADSSVEYRGVVYKEDFKNTNIAEYKLDGTDITYTTDQFIGSYDAVVAAVKDELSTLSYTSDEIWQALEPTGVAKNEVKIRELYLEERYEEIQNNLEKVLKNVLGTSVAYSNTSDVIDYIKKNKAELLLGLSYVSRWYNIDFNETNVQNIITYQPDFFGKQVSTLEWLVEVGSAGYKALDPKINDEKAASLVGENNNTENLYDILESYRNVFAKDKSFVEWFNSSVKAYVATGKAIDNVSGNEIGNSELYHQLNRRMTNANWDRAGGNIDFSNTILPLLTARKDRIYIISTGSSVQFGSLEGYVDSSLEKTNPEEYNKKLKETKDIINKVANDQAKHWEVWYAVANENVQDRLVSNKPVWDSLNMKKAGGDTWSEKFGAGASSSVKDFFGPIGKYRTRTNNEGFSTGTEVFYNYYALIGDGPSIWTHEQVHNWDGTVYFGGNGRRPGSNSETFAEGLLQAPRGRIRDAIGVNMYFDNTPENNPYPEYNSSPERFQNADDLKEYVKGMMDVLYVMDYAEAMAITKLPQEQQIARLTKLTTPQRGTSVHKDDRFVSITAEDISDGLNDINKFIDSGLALSRYYNNGKLGESAGTNLYTAYVKVNMFSPFYGLAQNDAGISGGYTFRRVAYELLAEYGYQAFIEYVSGKNATDKAAVEAIFKGAHNGNLTQFKKDMFKQRIDKLSNLKPVTFTVGNTTYTINNSTDLQNYMNNLVTEGNVDKIVNFKRAMYVAYMKDTKEFKTSIFNV